jgi:hypothetical protein
VLEAQVPQTKALLEKCDLSFRFPPGWGSTGHSKASQFISALGLPHRCIVRWG